MSCMFVVRSENLCYDCDDDDDDDDVSSHSEARGCCGNDVATTETQQGGLPTIERGGKGSSEQWERR